MNRRETMNDLVNTSGLFNTNVWTFVTNN